MAQPPGHGDTGDAGAGDEGTEHQRAGAHGLDDLVLGDGVGENAALNASAMLGAAIAEIDLGTHGSEQFALGLDVADLRDIFEDDLIFGEDGGSHTREGGVFCSGNFDGSEEGIAAAYNKLIHFPSLRKSYEDMGVEIGTEKEAKPSGRRLRRQER